MKWWEAPEYDKRVPMNFPDLRSSTPMRRIGKTVEFDSKAMQWASIPVRIYVGPSAL